MKRIPWMRAIAALSCLLVATVLAAAPRRAPAPPNPGEWEGEIAAFEASDRTNPPPRGAIVFTGSSTIRMWKTLAADFPGHRVVNRGFGGCRIEDVTHFADRIVIPYAPRLVVLRGVGNDINSGKSPEQVEADFRAFVEKVRGALPGVEIVFLSQNPTVARAANAADERDANARIRRMVEAGRGMRYLDIDDLTKGPDGRPDGAHLLADGLHFNAEGYRLLAARVRPLLGPPDTGRR